MSVNQNPPADRDGQIPTKLTELIDPSSLIQTLLQSAGLGIYLTQDSKFVYVNPSFEELSGYSLPELAGTDSLNLVHCDDRTAVRNQAIENLKHQRNIHPYEYRLIRKNGEVVWVLERILSINYMDKRAVMGIFMDISYRKKVEEALTRSEERYRTILEEMQDSYWETDLKGNFTFVNEASCRYLEYPREELIGMNSLSVTAPEFIKPTFKAFVEVYRTGKPIKIDLSRVLSKDNVPRYIETYVSLLRNDAGDAIGFRCIGRDITERKEFEQRLAKMATHDFLTGLPNRALLNDRFELAVANAHRKNENLAIMSLDLDRFKTINDTLGHKIGDELLKAVGKRLISTVRASDTVARIGGDEFLLVLQEIHHDEDAVIIADKIIDYFKKPFLIEDHSLQISTSIGIAVYPEDGGDLDTLMKNSDSAMYQAKKDGRNQYKLYK